MEVSQKKRSIGVTILAGLIIVSGALAVWGLFDPQNFINFYIKPWGWILYVLAVLFVAAKIFLGINVLKLKEWARKYLVIVYIAGLIFLALAPFVINKEFDKGLINEMQQSNVKPRPQDSKANDQAAEEQMKMMLEMTPLLIKVSKIIVYGGGSLFHIFVIFFFTRPKVKAQFE